MYKASSFCCDKMQTVLFKMPRTNLSFVEFPKYFFLIFLKGQNFNLKKKVCQAKIGIFLSTRLVKVRPSKWFKFHS